MKTTAEMIEVMQAHERGEPIELGIVNHPIWEPTSVPSWNWVNYKYRIAPKPTECWVWQYQSGRFGAVFDSQKDAERISEEIRSVGRAVLMREVL